MSILERKVLYDTMFKKKEKRKKKQESNALINLYLLCLAIFTCSPTLQSKTCSLRYVYVYLVSAGKKLVSI